MLACVALLATVAAVGQGRDSLRVTLFFRVGEASIDRSYMGNEERLQLFERAASELKTTDSSVTRVVISASASPEGNAAGNRALAARRADAAAALLRELLPMLNVPVERTSDFEYDWLSFRGVIAADSAVPAHAQLLEIIDNGALNDADRNYQIRRLGGGATFEYLKWNILRSLRTGTITLTIERPPQPEMPEPVQPRCLCGGCGMTGSDDVSECTCAMPLKECICADTKPTPPQPTLQSAPSKKRYRFALKTNLLFDAVGAANLGVELPVGKHLSLTADVAYSYWRINNLYALQTIQGGVTAKWWFNQSRGHLTGWNAGVYGMYCTRYDVQWLDGLQGDGFWSAGVQGGYGLPIGRKWRLEFAAAAGYVHTPEVRFYDRPERGHLMWRQTRRGVGRVSLTKLQLNLVWLLGKEASK